MFFSKKLHIYHTFTTLPPFRPPFRPAFPRQLPLPPGDPPTSEQLLPREALSAFSGPEAKVYRIYTESMGNIVTICRYIYIDGINMYIKKEYIYTYNQKVHFVLVSKM